MITVDVHKFFKNSLLNLILSSKDQNYLHFSKQRRLNL